MPFRLPGQHFQTELKGRAVILAVQFVLARDPQFRLRYGDVEQQVEALGGVSLENIRRAVIAIRSSKLPDPRVLGNAGSFFKIRSCRKRRPIS